jgi:hypothetical protein
MSAVRSSRSPPRRTSGAARQLGSGRFVAARNNVGGTRLPESSFLQPPRPARSVSYNDLIELARLCIKQAASTSNATAAAELRRMASEYEARAQALADEPHMPNIAAAFESSPQRAQPSQQQQQPQPDSPPGSEDEGAPD